MFVPCKRNLIYYFGRHDYSGSAYPKILKLQIWKLFLLLYSSSPGISHSQSIMAISRSGLLKACYCSMPLLQWWYANINSNNTTAPFALSDVDMHDLYPIVSQASTHIILNIYLPRHTNRIRMRLSGQPIQTQSSSLSMMRSRMLFSSYSDRLHKRKVLY